MNKVADLLTSFQQIAAAPDGYVKTYLAAAQKKGIGCFYYAPQELVHAAGMLPVGIWGSNIELSGVRSYLPSFFCSILQTAFEQGMQGELDHLAGVIIPANCDSLRAFGQNWKVAVPQVPFIPLVQPVNRKTEAGVKFLCSEYAAIKTALEKITGQPITADAIDNSIEVFNKYRQTMREFTAVAAMYPDLVSPGARHAVIKSGWYMDKGEYTAKVAELITAIRENPVKQWDGKKVVVTGIKMDSPDILNLLAEHKIAVVADDLAQETRLFRTDVQATAKEPVERLARYWSTMEGCSLLYDPEKKRIDMILNDVTATKADGVLVCMTKFCDPEEFDYPILKKALDARNIPHVYIETDLEIETDAQARTRIQAFTEIAVPC